MLRLLRRLLRLLRADRRAKKLKRRERRETKWGDSIYGVTWSGGSLGQRELERNAASSYAYWVRDELKAAEGPRVAESPKDQQ